MKISKKKYADWLLSLFWSLLFFSFFVGCKGLSKSKSYNRSIVIVSDVDKIEKHENELDVYLFINGDTLTKADIRFWKALSHRDIRTVSIRKYEFRSTVNRNFDNDYVVLKCVEKGSYMEMLHELRVKDEDENRDLMLWAGLCVLSLFLWVFISCILETYFPKAFVGRF